LLVSGSSTVGLIRHIEELSLNAWPALHTLLDDGWVLRLAAGYTRRANSVNPLYPGRRDAADKIAAAEALYHSQRQRVVFKMTPEVHPVDLDALLAERGYGAEATTSVQTLDVGLGLASPPTAPALLLEGEHSAEWLAAYARMNVLDAARQAILQRILAQIIPARRFASLSQDGQIVACGLGVLQAGMLGLYDIVTDPRFRRQGHARHLLQGLLSWGQQAGAQRAYLQVMLNNAPALALYAQLGFREAYQYWYRVSA
jgi:N-acetylglutamate synthase